MIIPPIYDVCRSSVELAGLLNDSYGELKLYPFGVTPHGVSLPYATWQNVAGGPQNNLSDYPDADKATLQVNVWGATSTQVIQVVQAIANAIELQSHITRWGNQSKDDATKAFGYDFDVDWFTHR